MYVVLDVESTGGPIDKDAIIEIALFRYDGDRITDQLISLVYTDRPIQPFVQKMTGIRQHMLRSAPRWHEIAKRVVEITEGAILVGHGVSFDYRMVKQEFERLGYPYERSTIDTVNWSRKLFPGESSYKLTSLCESLGIWLPRNHRAGDDARATVDLFRKLLDKDVENRIRSLGEKGDAQEKPSERLQKLLREVRDEAGIFYLYDSENNLLRSGLAEKMNGELSRIFLSPEADDVNIQQKVTRLRCEPTGTRLIAQLRLYAEERASGKTLDFKGTALVWNEKLSRIQLIKGLHLSEDHLAFFRNISDAKKLLKHWQRQFPLCPVHQAGTEGPACINFQDNQACISSCEEEKDKEEFIEKIDSLFPILRLQGVRFTIRIPGRKSGERAWIEVKEGRAGYFFYTLEKDIENEEQRNKRLTSIPLDAYTSGLLWIQYIRHPKSGQLELPDSLDLNKPE
jgi:DNA polymerase-3 subunit epsilon